MTIIGSNYFNKEKNSLGQTKGSGSMNSPRLMTGQSNVSKGVGSNGSRAGGALLRKPTQMEGSNSSMK